MENPVSLRGECREQSHASPALLPRAPREEDGWGRQTPVLGCSCWEGRGPTAGTGSWQTPCLCPSHN